MYRIMLVEAEANTLSALRHALAKLSPAELDGEAPIIEPCASAAEALARSAQARFDLVISDFHLPDMDGVEFLKAMVGLQADAARIVLSGYAELESVIEAVTEVQDFRCMVKPWHDAELRLVVRQGLSHRAVSLENRRLADLVQSHEREILRQRKRLEFLEDDEAAADLESVTLDEGVDYPDETGIEIDDLDLDDRR